MNFDSFSANLDAENAFWAGPNRPDTYDKESFSSCYQMYDEMVKQPKHDFYRGDWIRSEDYRRDIERLEKLLKDNGIEF